MIAVADTSFVIALFNRNDKRHNDCVSAFKRQRTIYLPQSTLTEITYFELLPRRAPPDSPRLNRHSLQPQCLRRIQGNQAESKLALRGGYRVLVVDPRDETQRAAG